MLAAANGQESVADLLLKRGAQVDLQDSNGTTALLEAAQRGHVHVMDMLLERGAEVSLANNDGVTALTAAFLHRKTDARLLLMSAIGSKHEAWVQACLDHGTGRVNAASMRGRWAHVPRCGAAEKAELARREEAAPRQLGRPPEVVICAPGLRGGGAANVRRCTLPARAISCASAAFQECALRTFRVFRSPEAARVRVYDRRRYLPSGAPG